MIFFYGSPDSVFAGKEEISECHTHIKPLHMKRDLVAQLDGIWGLFEKKSELQVNSVIAINLDKKINAVIFHLEYLCDTLSGIPMAEVARYVRDGIEKKGKESFRKELILLGKSVDEIDVWFKFTRFSIKNKDRPLELKLIIESIKNSMSYVDSYVALAKKIDGDEFDNSIIKGVIKLAEEIDGFFKSDKFLNQALTENSSIPYVDINESSGGS
mgnify:CR=1 FL=1